MFSFSESRGPAVTDEGEEGNIYEEITETVTIPKHRRLFFNISQGRRDNLEMYKFADWDLEDKLRPKIDKVGRHNLQYETHRLTKSSLISG